MIDRTISHYRILEEIGRGGMGVVYKARDTKLDRDVALKFLPAQFSADPEERKRFIHEAKAAAALNHANIITVHEIGEHEGQVFIAMEYVEGQTLKDMISGSVGAYNHTPLPIAPRPLPLAQVLDIASQIASGLTAAHAKGIVHRDLKPANIMLTEEGTVKIVDFGLAKLKGMSRLTKSGTTLGTVAYMSPEQALGKEVDQRSDIWSLGVILYEMLTGKLPFPGEYDQAMLYAVINEEPERLTKTQPNALPGMERIISRALAKDPAKRYQDIDDLLEDLKAVSEGFAPLKAKVKPTVKRFFGIRRIYWFAGLAIAAAFLVSMNIGKIKILFTKNQEVTVIRSLAVLPLANYSGDADQEYFSDGMTDALIAGLAQIKAIKVISRTSVMQYKETKKPLPQIARELGVEGIVEGSVMRSGGRVRITAQLIDARQDRHLWANNYEREMTDVLALQSEVVQAIAAEIRAQVTPQERERLSVTRTVDPEAYENYLLGHFYLNQCTPSALQKSIELFHKAIENDPKNAAAYAGLCNAYLLFKQMSGSPSTQYVSEMREAALKAVEIDETLADGHIAMGIVKRTDWDWQGSEREFKRAIELNPNNSRAHLWYAQLLGFLSRHEEALTQITLARELDPMDQFIAANVGGQQYYARRYDDGLTTTGKVLELFPNYFLNHWIRGFLFTGKGMYNEAIVEYRKAVDLSEGSLECLQDLGYALAKAGRTVEALKILDKLHEESRKRYVPPRLFMSVYLGLGQTDRVFKLMEKMYQEHDEFLVWFLIDPLLQSLHSDPRFQDLWRRVNLPPGDGK